MPLIACTGSTAIFSYKPLALGNEIEKDAMRAPPPHALTLLLSLPEDVRNTLNDCWITTIEEFVAVSSTEEGRKRLVQRMGGDLNRLKEALLQGESVLGHEQFALLSTPVPPRATGAIFDTPDKVTN